MAIDYFGKAVVQNFPFLLGGIYVTLQLIGLGLVVAMGNGLLIALLRVSPLRLLRGVGGVYVDFFRNVPPLILIFMFYAGLPSIGITLPAIWCGVLGMGFYLTTYAAEAIRAGIQSVDIRQLWAARSLGFSYLSSMRHVILPQAAEAAFPALVNVGISVVKGTLFFSIIGVDELFYRAEIVESNTWRTWEVFGFTAVVYLVLVVPASRLAHRLEAGWAARRR